MLVLNDSSGSARHFTLASVLSQIVDTVAGKLANTESALLALRTYADGNAVPAKAEAAIKGALRDAALDVPQLKALLDGPVGKFFLDEDASGAPVARTLEHAQKTDGLPYALSTTTDEKSVDTGDVHLTFTGSADAHARIDVLLSDAVAKDSTLPSIPSGDALLAFEVGGNLDMHGAFKVPFNGGSGSASVAGGVGIKLDARFQWAKSNSAIGAVTRSVRDFPSPWSLDAVSDSLVKPSAQGEYRGLRQIALNTTGSLQLNGSIGYGRTWLYDRLAPHQAISATAGISVDLNVGWSRTGTFDIRIQRGVGGVEVDVRKQGESDLSLGADLTLGVTIEGLAKIAQPIVDQWFPDPGTLMEKLHAWSAPGTLLVNKLQAKLPANDPLLKLLGQYLLGTMSLDDAKDEITRILLAAVQERVDADPLVEFWKQAANANTLAQTLASRTADVLGIDQAVVGTIVGDLATPLSAAIAEVYDDFQKFVDGLVSEAGNGLATLLTPFQAINRDAKALADEIDGEGSKLIKPLTDLLAAYQSVRDKVVSALAVGSKLKIGLALKAAYEKQSANASELRFTILVVTPRTRLLYRALLLGRMDTVWNMLQGALDAKEITPPTGAFTSVVTRTKQLDFSVYLGDWALAWSQSSTSTVRVKVLTNGLVSLDSEDRFSGKSVATAFGASDGASYVGSIDVVKILNEPGSSALPVTFGFALSYSDEKMDRRDLEKYLVSLEQFSAPLVLLDDAAVRRALAQYPENGAAASLETAISVDADSLRRLIDALSSESTILTVARKALFMCGFFREYSKTLLSIAKTQDVDGVTDLLAELGPGRLDVERKLKALMTAAGVPTGATVPTGAFDRLVVSVLRINTLAVHFVDLLKAFRDSSSLLRNARTGDPQKDANALAAAASQLNSRITDDLDGWFSPPPYFREAPPLTIALLVTIATLSSGFARPKLLIPILRTTVAGQPRILIF